jgi:hypothetical protein
MRRDRGSLSTKNCWRSEVKILRKHAQNVQVHSTSDHDCKGFTRMSMRRPYSLSYYPSLSQLSFAPTSTPCTMDGWCVNRKHFFIHILLQPYPLNLQKIKALNLEQTINRFINLQIGFYFYLWFGLLWHAGNGSAQFALRNSG